MQILDVRSLAIPEVKVIRYRRFTDDRGYFTETYRATDFDRHPALMSLAGLRFTQCNESRSRAGTIRGMHFQWNPPMGKLVRTISGRMVDLVLDIRQGSPTFGSVLAYDLPADPEAPYGEWIWVPVGFAHGNYYPVDSRIEYFCTGEWSPDCEASISPLAADLDWSLCEPSLRREFLDLVAAGPLMSERDRSGYSLTAWTARPDSSRFAYRAG